MHHHGRDPGSSGIILEIASGGDSSPPPLPSRLYPRERRRDGSPLFLISFFPAFLLSFFPSGWARDAWRVGAPPLRVGRGGRRAGRGDPARDLFGERAHARRVRHRRRPLRAQAGTRGRADRRRAPGQVERRHGQRSARRGEQSAPFPRHAPPPRSGPRPAVGGRGSRHHSRVVRVQQSAQRLDAALRHAQEHTAPPSGPRPAAHPKPSLTRTVHVRTPTTARRDEPAPRPGSAQTPPLPSP